MSEILYFTPTVEHSSQRILKSRYRIELREIEQFHKYLDAKIARLSSPTSEEADQDAPRYSAERMVHNLLRLNHECKVALSGRSTAPQLYQLLEKKDLYFQFGLSTSLRRTF